MPPDAAGARKPRQLNREQQIDLVVKLLQKHERHVAQARDRVERGEGLVAAGVTFPIDVLRAALAEFEAKCPPPAAPPASGPRTPQKKRKAPSADENRKPNIDHAKPGACSPPGSEPPAKSSPKLCSPKLSRTPRSAKRRKSGAGTESTDGLTVRELKARLFEQGLDCSGCVEKADLQELWDRFQTWRAQPLAELQDLCQVDGGIRFDSVDECAKYLAEAAQRQKRSQAPAQPAATPRAPEPPAPAVDREQEAKSEVQRILPLKREHFVTPTAWGFAVLGVPTATREVATVQRAYRTLMRKLHPDRAGQSEDLVKAVEKVREAKETCERGLSRQEPPTAPRGVRSETLSAMPGKRKFQLCWTAPVERECAPIRRYVVAAFDPAYGKALTVTVLEPDYSQELRSFVGIENLTSYVMAEEDLQKMPKLWTQSMLTVQVAAANEAGQSPWTTHKIPLNAPAGACAGSLSEPTTPAAAAFPRPPPAGPQSFASAANVKSKQSSPDEVDVATFNVELRKLRGSAKLRAFLEPQRKGILQAWLRTVNWSASGSKQDLVERVIFIREAMVA